MLRALRRLLACACVLAAGCSAPEPPPRPREPPPPTALELAGRLSKALAAWQSAEPPQECSAYFTACAAAFAKSAGFDPADPRTPNPRGLLGDPDPEWIPRWREIPDGAEHRDVAFGAMAYAAIMRRFFTACRRDHGAMDLVRAEEQKRLEDELAAADKLTDPYARLGRLVLYRKALKRRMPDLVGPRYELELAIFDRFSQSGRGFLYEMQSQRSEDAAAMRPAFGFEEERDLHCIAQGIPAWQDQEAVPWSYLHVPIAAVRVKSLEEKVRAAQDLEQKLPAGEKKLPEIDDASPPQNGTLLFLPKKVLGVTPAVVNVREDKDKVLVVELFAKRVDEGVDFDCEAPTGCKKRDETRELTIVVRLPERPDVPVQKNDQLALAGTVTRWQTRLLPAGARWTARYRLEIDAVHVLEIWRAGLLVADYFVQ